jgi:oligopeptide transport system substrate-binding protein
MAEPVVRLLPRVRVLLTRGVLLLAVAGCSDPAPKASRTLRFAWSEPVGTLEPPNVRGYADQQLLRLLFSGLTRSTVAGGLKSGIAARWSSEDARTWRFELRPGQTFSDGSPVTSHDVVRAWGHLARTKALAPNVPFLADIDGMPEVIAGSATTVRGLETPDSLTLIVRLTEPRATFPFVVSRTEYLVTAASSTPTQPVGSGPWRWQGGHPGDSLLTLVRNDSVTLPGVDTLEMRVVPLASLAERMGRGDIDCVDQLLPAVRPSLALQPNVSLFSSSWSGLARLVLRGSHPALRDLRVRRALAHALDLPSIVQGTGEANVGLVGSRVPQWMAQDTTARPPVEYNPRLARRLLEEAGAGALSLRLSRLPYAVPSDTATDYLYFIRDYWKAVGVNVEIVQPADFWRGLVDSVVDVQPQYIFASFPDAAELLNNLYGSRSPAARVAPPLASARAFDALTDSARRSLDASVRARLVHSADSIVAAETPDILLWQIPFTSARRTAVPSCAAGLLTDMPLADPVGTP